ncbi:Protein of unknown function [Lutimaribacter pacificus]|uniref:Glycosyltransferase 61 catalytic domain-containing protein n=1 Tax=Lutimaribacter pacificus TaxID=391948 RepID=A0A1H0CLV1_9RHOB|nr:glycosyltransferase 61 family protein [Lutimaribacter pacificus]SDN58823.1 Protein of unknown function [Lutimaribacter pacificus]SHJ43158.1 Protein of unknown function [Lutimaribacter pacificus]
MRNTGKLTIAPCHCPADTLVTAQSHLVDRFVADCEIVHLPVKTVVGGTLSFDLTDTVAHPPEPPRRSLSLLRRPAPQRVEGRVFVDFRLRFPQNWAHFLNNHLPILFALAEDAGCPPEGMLLVLPGDTPRYIIQAAQFFGLETLCTDAPVEGRALNFTADPWTGIRPARADWAHLPYPQQVLSQCREADSQGTVLPARAFLSRRKTRVLENEPEIESLLAERGFTRLYPEDLSVADQFRLFEETEEIVAIHGAALAPLLYRSGQSRLERLIELFPCGHMTDVYRVMSHQVGCRWLGVRGRIKPEHVAGAYDLEKPFVKYSLQSFAVDPRSLTLALETG